MSRVLFLPCLGGLELPGIPPYSFFYLAEVVEEGVLLGVTVEHCLFVKKVVGEHLRIILDGRVWVHYADWSQLDRKEIWGH